MIFTTFTLALLGLSVANPNGAPSCVINEQKIQAGMSSASDVTLGYSLLVQPISATSFAVQVVGSRPDYQGILLYAVSAAQPGAHVGQFSFKNQTKWKFQSQSVCSEANVTGSLVGKSTITHAIPDKVLISKNVTFTWTGTEKEVASGGLSFEAVVASLDAGKPKWQKVPSAKFGTAGPTSNPTNPDYPNPTSEVSATETGTSSALSNQAIRSLSLALILGSVCML